MILAVKYGPKLPIKGERGGPCFERGGRGGGIKSNGKKLLTKFSGVGSKKEGWKFY